MEFFIRSWLVLSLIAAVSANAGTLLLYPERDATLIEHPHGESANGSGPALFVGRTAQTSNGLRRALLYFDIAGLLPLDARIEDVFLSLYLTPSNPAPASVSVHRILDDWREGPSSSSGGGGAPAQSGDTTWLHTDYDVAYWKHIGGHFVARASAATLVSDSNVYTWADSKQLLADVRLWLHAPQRNFGWLIKGDEETSQSVKRFASRETSTDAHRPVLAITYSLPGEQ